MSNFTSAQLKAVELKNEAIDEIPYLEPFFHGRIPNFSHYKRLNIEREQAIKIAQYGYITALSKLGVKLFFTQSLILGAAILGTHHNIAAILPSQYGKSFESACIGLILASEGEEVSVAGFDQDTTKKIMNEVWRILPDTPDELKKLLTTPVDKFENAQTSMSRNHVGFIGGGAVSGITLGGRYADSISGNKAVGQSGNYIIDESATVPDANYAETGRSEVAYRKNGKPYLTMEISNPHQVNHFYRTMTEEEIPRGTLLVWADIRISIEEGKHVFSDTDLEKPDFTSTKFFKNEKTCISYYLCEFGSLESNSFFSTSPTVDNSFVELSAGQLVLGLDSANRGADSIMGAILQGTTSDKDYLRIVEVINFKPPDWVDHETPKHIEDLIVALVKKTTIVAIVLDLGGGEWLYQRLLSRFMEEDLNVALKGVYFNNSPTKERVRPNVTELNDGTANGAELGVNKRAEMHLDLRDLMEHRKIRFTQKVTDLLREELLAIGAEKYTNGGKLQLEDKTKGAKRRLGRSPDTLDAVVLAVHCFILYHLNLMQKNYIELY